MTKLLTALLSFAAAVGVFLLYTQGAYDFADTLKTDIAQYDAALNKSRELQELKRSLLARYNTFSSDDLTRLNKLLPDHIDNVRLTLDLDSLAARYGMAIQNVTLNTKRPVEDKQGSVLGALSAQHKPYDSLMLQFSTIGTYDSFRRFILDLEASLRIVDVTALMIEPMQLTAQPQQATSTPPTKGKTKAPPPPPPPAFEPTYKYTITIKTFWLK